jgi:hypothetical protein
MSKKAIKVRNKKLRRFCKAVLKYGITAKPKHKKISGRSGSGVKGRKFNAIKK